MRGRLATAVPTAVALGVALGVTLGLALGVAALTLLGAGPAQADGYRYWSFWDRDAGAWTYATQGPSFTHPADGDVQGFRFAVSADSQDASTPRGAAGFGAICAKTPAADGSKRVALVIDFGTAADATGGAEPPAERTECAQVAEDATSAEALAAVAKPLRYNSAALLCSIAGYPRTGCGEHLSSGGAGRQHDSHTDPYTTASSDEENGGP
jgi:hypothetical protein